MKQERRQEGIGKRPIAMPVVLVLLVFSLIGNVFLYTKHLQSEQNSKYEKGLAIYEAAVETRSYYQATADGLRGLLEANSLGERIELLFALGEISEQRSAVLSLLELGAAFKPEYEAGLDAIVGKLDGVKQAVAAVGHYEGALNAEDRKLLEQLLAEYEANEAIAAAFNSAVIDYKSSVIRLAAGYGWLEVTDQLFASLTT